MLARSPSVARPSFPFADQMEPHSTNALQRLSSPSMTALRTTSSSCDISRERAAADRTGAPTSCCRWFKCASQACSSACATASFVEDVPAGVFLAFCLEILISRVILWRPTRQSNDKHWRPRPPAKDPAHHSAVTSQEDSQNFSIAHGSVEVGIQPPNFTQLLLPVVYGTTVCGQSVIDSIE